MRFFHHLQWHEANQLGLFQGVSHCDSHTPTVTSKKTMSRAQGTFSFAIAICAHQPQTFINLKSLTLSQSPHPLTVL